MKQAGHKQHIDGSGSAIRVEVRWVLVTPTTATNQSERHATGLGLAGGSLWTRLAAGDGL